MQHNSLFNSNFIQDTELLRMLQNEHNFMHAYTANITH